MFRTRRLSYENKMHQKGTKQVRESAAVSDCAELSRVRKVGEPRRRKLSAYEAFCIYSIRTFTHHLSWVFDHWSRHLRESEQTVRVFWQQKVWTHCEFQCYNGDHLRMEKRKVRIFGKVKCKLVANFSANMVTSLPGLSLPSACLSLSLVLSPSLSIFLSPHAQHIPHWRRLLTRRVLSVN